MPEGRIHWVSSNWSKSDLDGKSVQFDFPFAKDRWVKGMGRFRVKENVRGELSIWIEGMPLPSAENKYYFLDQSLTNAIHRCLPNSTFDFNLFIGSVPSPWSSRLHPDSGSVVGHPADDIGSTSTRRKTIRSRELRMSRREAGRR
jgi:hypothetical protein